MTPIGQSAQVRPRAGVLTLISVLMIGSAVIRLALEAGPAMARGPEPSTAEQNDHPSSSADPNMLLSELLRREDAVRQHEENLRDKERALAIAEQAVTARLAELQTAEESLRATLAIADQAAEADLIRLTEVYQNMKPKDAAALFETMDPVFAAGFLSRMPPEAAADIMAGMQPDAAYTISVVIAGRNANAPQE